jgi:hypothetical protein
MTCLRGFPEATGRRPGSLAIRKCSQALCSRAPGRYARRESCLQSSPVEAPNQAPQRRRLTAWYDFWRAKIDSQMQTPLWGVIFWEPAPPPLVAQLRSISGRVGMEESRTP